MPFTPGQNVSSYQIVGLVGARKTAVCAGLDRLAAAAATEPVPVCKQEFEEALERAKHAKDNNRIRHNPDITRGSAAETRPDEWNPTTGDLKWTGAWSNTILFGTPLADNGSFLGAGANNSVNLLAGALAHEADHMENSFDTDNDGFSKTWADSCARLKSEMNGSALEIKVLHAIEDAGGLTPAENEEINDRIERMEKFRAFHAVLLPRKVLTCIEQAN